MDWWDLGILVCTVLLTKCPPTEGSAEGFDYAPGTYSTKNADRCPPHSIFCFETQQCLTFEGLCLATPTCDEWEVLQTTSLGYERCVPFEDTCWPDMEEACELDGTLRCVPKGQCHSLEAKMRLHAYYSEVVGMDYDAAAVHFKTLLANITALNPQQLWGFHLVEGPEGSLYIVFRAPLSAYKTLATIAKNEAQFLIDRSNSPLYIDWTETWIGEVLPDEEHVDDRQKCGRGQPYCFQSKECVYIDGTCPAEPTCGMHQMVCNRYGSLTCVDEGSCTYVEGGIHLDSVDYSTVIGDDLENMKDFEDHLKETLVQQIPNSQTSDFWNFDFIPDKGSIYITFSASGHVYSSLEALMKPDGLFITDLAGNELHINWEKTYAELKRGSGDDDDDDDGPYFSEGKLECGYYQVFCYETMGCVDVNGHCLKPECDYSHAVCYIDGEFSCAKTCSYVEFIVSVNATYAEVVGNNHENYYSLKNAFVGQFAESLGVEEDMIIELHPVDWEGSLKFWGKMPHQFFDVVHKVLKEDKSLALSYDNSLLEIDFEESHAYMGTFGDEDDNNDKWDDDESDYCPDCHKRRCLSNELFCLEKNECVDQRGGCIEDEMECAHSEDCLDDRKKCGYNHVLCLETGKCIGDDGKCNDTIDDPRECPHARDCHKERRKCGRDELFCLEKNECVDKRVGCIDDEMGCAHPEDCLDDRKKCGYYQVLCLETGKCMGDDGKCNDTIDDPRECPHARDCHKERRKCGRDELFCMEKNECQDQRVGCIDDEMGCAHPEDCLDDRKKCGYYQVLCLETGKCMGDDGKCNDTIDDPRECPHERDCHKERRKCGRDELFCLEKNECQDQRVGCIDDEMGCAHPEDCLDDRKKCGYYQVLCLETGKCMGDDGKCNDTIDDPRECPHARDCHKEGRKCGRDELFCLEKNECQDQRVGCIDDEMGCAHPEDCLDDRKKCGYYQVLCLETGKCMGDDGKCNDTIDDPRECPHARDCHKERRKCGRDELFCLEKNECQDQRVGCIDDEMGCAHPEDCLDDRKKCGYYQVLCLETGKCMGDDGKCNDTVDDPRECPHARDCHKERRKCGRDELFCLEKNECQDQRVGCIDDEMGCAHPEDCLDDRKKCGYYQVLCLETGKCIGDDGKCNDTIDDPRECPHARDCHKERRKCGRDELFCLEKNECQDQRVGCIDDEMGCAHPEDCLDDRKKCGYYQVLCLETGKCIGDDGKCNDTIDDPRECPHARDCHKERRKCGRDELFCLEKNECEVQRVGCIDDEMGCTHPEDCLDDRTKCGYYQVLCLETGKCMGDDGKCNDSIDDPRECPHARDCHKERRKCGRDELFCLEKNECEDRRVGCIDDEMRCAHPEDCLDDRKKCGYYQVLCLETGKCMGGDGKCNDTIDDPRECPHARDCHKERRKCGRDEVLCLETGKCMGDDGKCNDTIDDPRECPHARDCHKERRKCGRDELYCFDTRQCRSQDGGCSDTNSEKCPNPDEEACDDGQGGYTCKPAGCGDITPFTAEGSLTLEGDFSTIVEDGKEAVIQEFQAILPALLDISPDVFLVTDVLTGSIIVIFELRLTTRGELQTYIIKLQALVTSNQTVVLFGMDLLVTAVYVRDPGTDDNSPDKGDGNNSSVSCPNDQIFCADKNICVSKEYDLATCQQEVTECNENQVFCMDEHGYGKCVLADTCKIQSIKLRMLTDADYNEVIKSEAAVNGDLREYFAKELNIEQNLIRDIEFFKGSFGVLLILYPFDPAEAVSIFEIFEKKVMQSDVKLPILGVIYIVKPDSFKVQVESVVFVPDCVATDTCTECGDQETQCDNLDGTETATCVPTQICRLESACPIPVKNSFSTCEVTCDLTKDKKTSDGKLCCPNACGGGVYINPLEYYVCPRDEESGVCLTDADTQCDSEKEIWCTVSFTCTTEEQCDKLVLQHIVDEITQSDVFIVRLPLMASGASFVDIFKSTQSGTTLKDKVSEFGDSVKQKLMAALHSEEHEVNVADAGVYLEGTESDTFTIYAEILVEYGSVTAEDIKEKIKGLSISYQSVDFAHVPGDAPSITAVLANAKQIYIMPKPIAANTESDFDLLSIIPDALFSSTPVNAVLDCSETENVQVVAGDTVAPTNDVTSSQKIGIIHSLTEVERVKCQLTSNQLKNVPDDVSVNIGFIALPKTLSKLGTVTDLGLTVDHIETDEDSKCLTLPEDLFTFRVDGDGLFDTLRDWPAKMTGSGEVWRGHFIGEIEVLLLDYHLLRRRVLNNIRATVASSSVTSDDQRVAKLTYQGEPLKDNVPIDILTSKDRMKDLKICIREDYSGTFSLDITEVRSDSAQFSEVQIPIKVKATNDAPILIEKGVSEATAHFSYPAAPLSTSTEGITVPEFRVGTLTSMLAIDPDSPEELGMALTGIALATSTTAVGGKLEFSRDGGTTWEVAPTIEIPDSDEITHTVIHLAPTDSIRFTPAEESKSKTWKMYQSPKIVFLVWDLSNENDVTTNQVAPITFKICNSFEKGMSKYCSVDTSTAYSDLVVLSMLRDGCDGIPNSGQVELRCGCDDDTSCFDCSGTRNGNATLDECNICEGSNGEFDCAVSECRKLKPLFCEQEDSDLEAIGGMCGEGEKLHPDILDTCGYMCIPTGETVPMDQCGVQCGKDECLDCGGEINMNIINNCGDCQSITTTTEECDGTTIGYIRPHLSNPKDLMNITFNVYGLAQNEEPEIGECVLELEDTEVTEGQVPTVTSTTFNPGSETEAPSIVLTLQASTDESPSTGKFAVRCTIDGNSVSTADNVPANDHQFLRRYDNPTLETVTPKNSLITDLKTDITITGKGFIDTDNVFCLVPCSDIPDMNELCEFKEVNGKRISDTEVTCPTNRLINKKRGFDFRIFVILEPLRNIDRSRLPQSNSVTFSVVMPAPVVVSAVLDRGGCKMLPVQFNTKVTGADGEACSNYFEQTVYDDPGAKCILTPGSRKMYIEYNTPIAEGTELIFKSNVIKSAAQHGTDNVEYLTGSVKVEPDEQEEKGKPVVVIDPTIPDKVGCSPITFNTIIRNKGCWDVQVSWTVTADGGDAAHVIALQNAIDQNNLVKESQLVSGVTYTVKMTWTAGKHSGSDSKTFMKDSDASAAVKITGIKDDLDVTKAISLAAKTRLCENDGTNVEILWTLDDPKVSLDPAFRIIIQAGTLEYGRTYELTYTVKYGSGSTISGSVSFSTKPFPIEARIVYEGDTSKRKISHNKEENLTLSCINNADSSAGNKNYECVWTCKSNKLSPFVGKLLPCIVYSEADKQLVPLKLTGPSITLPASEKENLIRTDLREKWCLSMSLGSQESEKSCRMVYFKENPRQLHYPELKPEDNLNLEVSETHRVEIFLRCRKATWYSWATGDDGNGDDADDDNDNDDDNDEALLLKVKPYLVEGSIERAITYKETRYVPCGIVLNLDDANLIPRKQYRVSLYMKNRQGVNFVANSRDVVITYIPELLPGVIEAKPEEEPIIALSTKIKVVLSSWNDETKLRCYIYADPQNGKKIRLNTSPVEANEQITITLQNGDFVIVAKCCDEKRCAVTRTDNVLIVQSTNSTGFVNAIDRELMLLTLLDSDLVLSFAGMLLDMMGTVSLGEAEKQRTGDVVIQAIKTGFSRAFVFSSTKDETLVTLETVPRVITKDVDKRLRKDLQSKAKGVAKEATQRGHSERRRKKRSTTEFSEPSGLLEDEAVTLLKVFDTTVSEENLTKDDALDFIETVHDVMLAMCQVFTGSTPWVAPATLSYVRVHRTNLAGYASLHSDVSCDTCDEVDYPAKVNYGDYLETFFNDTWDCTVYYACTDVCVASVQLNIDIVTLTASKEIVAPTRRSDIILLKMINPETYAVEELIDLPTPIQATLTLNGTIDMDKYDYKCLMWVSEDWSDGPCDTSTPTLDPTSSQYTAVCTCYALGFISIFQELKPDEVVTTATTSPVPDTTTTSDTDDGPTTPEPTDATSTIAPSKVISIQTKHISITFIFLDDYVSSVGSSVTEFIAKIKQLLATNTGYSTNNFKNMQVESGSIIVTFELHAAGSGYTLGQMVYKVENMITTGSIAFTTPDGTPLNIKPGSFSYKEISEDDEGDESSGSNNLLVIIGGALGGLVIICITVIIVLLIVKNKKQRTHPARHGSDEPAPRYSTPPPTYASAQAPPPYMYVEPPRVNKWVEDELNDKKTPTDQKRPPSNGSNRSGSSFEKKLTQKAQSFEPTPVGSNNLLVIIGGALGGLVIICITVIIVLLIVKNKKQRTHPARHGSDEPAPRYSTPPPTYASAPAPPPYMYVEPPRVNKWVEDELNDKKTPTDQKRPPSNGSNRSGSSFEKKLTQKAQSFEPTPVGE